jgi:demethylmenaquinone methyltransferase/2-methoxy-6-polyprenyl-1,4-benzoquinol methylase
VEPALPPLVASATARACRAGFSFSCDPAVGRLLAVLAAHLPDGARVLELGTGAGVGTAWIVSALQPRATVTVTTVEQDPQTAALAAQEAWPAQQRARQGEVRRTLLSSPLLTSIELSHGSGVILSTRLAWTAPS